MKNKQSYFINIYLLPDDEICNKSLEINSYDKTNYNNNSKKYIPHSTLIMKSLYLEEIEIIKKEISKIDFSWLELNTDKYVCDVWEWIMWSGVYLKWNKKLNLLKEQIFKITSKFKNKKRDKNAYIIDNYFEKNEIPIILEKDALKNKDLHITFWLTDLREKFKEINFSEKVKFNKICIWIMWNYGSVRKNIY